MNVVTKKSDEGMMTEIIREYTAVKETKKLRSEQVLFLAKRVEVQRALKTLIEGTKETKDPRNLTL